MPDVFQIELKVRTNRPIYPHLRPSNAILLPLPFSIHHLRAINMPNIPPQKHRITHLNKIVYGVSFFLPTFMSIRYVSQFNHFVLFAYKVFHFLIFKGLIGSYLNFPRSLDFKGFWK